MASFVVETGISVNCEKCGEGLAVEWFEDDGRLEVTPCPTCVEAHVPVLVCGDCDTVLVVVNDEESTVVMVAPCPTCINADTKERMLK